MFNYGIGGQEVKQDASEAMADLAPNKTLFVQKLTNEESYTPECVYDLKTVEEVFAHFQPQVEVDFSDAEGNSVSETIRFQNVGSFSPKSITDGSPFLQGLAVQQEQYQKIVKQLRTNKAMKAVVENAETKKAFLDAIDALLQELEEND